MHDLRHLEAGDEAFLRALFEEVRADAFASLPLPDAQKQSLIEMQYRAQKAQYEFSYPEAENSIVVLGDQSIGVLRVDRKEAGTRLVEIALLSSQRRRGIGTALLRGLIAEGRPVLLSVERANPARRLYERLGFVVMRDDGVYLEMTLT